MWSSRANAAPSVAAALPDASNVYRMTLIGPSGQVYEPSGDSATWTRHALGGIAADVTGATRADNAIVVAGRGTPMYRFADATWRAVRIGQRGKTVLGNGPHAAVAIGRQVFVSDHNEWLRIAEAPANVTALWAGSKQRIFIATAGGVFSSSGKEFTKVSPLVALAFVNGAEPASEPWLMTATSLAPLRSSGKSRHAITPGDDASIVAATIAPDGTAFMLARIGSATTLSIISDASGARHTTSTTIAADAQIAVFVVDRTGKLAIITRTGDIEIFDGQSWHPGTLIDAVAPAHPGVGPATTR